ncbi:heme oxygenase-like protein [Sodiomyces alkalinus F11]|uniref:Heme oxygenase-like protein n=1 Tax=Sodiomyces alkalinus (strain CBS 110278 / VKM F-3762 / F11) TaxID=1314773 RepID=A0A3N2Q6D4_SODAK|nr:heme oxygenase-like protein [Sodiomyces alkalinus F11]ROT42312.1 heme oxygenase-like protein [Sodiomyces alkalinus F11]
MASFSLTQTLLTSSPEAYTRATTSPFLTSAAAGTTPKSLLSRWLANDRLYIHAYIRGAGRLLSFLSIPDLAPPADSPNPDPATRLLDWLVDALVNVRREENFFIETAARFDLSIDLPTTCDDDNDNNNNSPPAVPDDQKLEGLRRWEFLFNSVAPGPAGQPLPWLEAAVLFWGTEVCYLDAWSGVKGRLVPQTDDPSQDADGGALRTQFLHNWTNDEFAEFVHKLARIIDDAVAEMVASGGEEVKAHLLERVKPVWQDVLSAEQSFWPAASE